MDAEELEKREQLEHWLMQQPLEKRKLDQSDRQVAMLAGNEQTVHIRIMAIVDRLKSTLMCNKTQGLRLKVPNR
ncbi:unnamed protein product [Strongylus vulgaris]|uniref:Uncharacterized protein n=1 Tax=Strongylus vulgaris TaxID=40348 RepID=A0A3P7L1B2_STRVU|nr:unnamed protein product [Strongylus vulgaris]